MHHTLTRLTTAPAFASTMSVSGIAAQNQTLPCPPGGTTVPPIGTVNQ